MDFCFYSPRKKPHLDYKLWIKDDKEFEMNRLIVLEEYRNIHLVLELPMIYCAYKNNNNNEMLDDTCFLINIPFYESFRPITNQLTQLGKYFEELKMLQNAY